MYKQCSYLNCMLEFTSKQHANDHYHEEHGSLHYIVTSWPELESDKMCRLVSSHLRLLVNLIKTLRHRNKTILAECDHANIEYLEIYETKEHKGGYRLGRRCKDCHLLNLPDLTNMAGNDLRAHIKELGKIVKEWNHFKMWGF